MKNKERFDRAIKALVKGFLNGTLKKGSCSACAVGNIVAECMGIKVQHRAHFYQTDPNAFWSDVFITYQDGEQVIQMENYQGNARINIDITGYSVEELAKVEYSFEKNSLIPFTRYCSYSQEEIMQDQYNGLMAVVEVLCKIEEIENVSEYKEMFAYKV